MVIDPVQAAIGLDQAEGCLGPHPLDAGDIVRGIPHQGLHVDPLLGSDTIVLPHDVRVDNFTCRSCFSAGQEDDRGLIRDQLEAVPVPGHYIDLHAGGFGPGGHGSDQVIGLIAVKAHRLKAQGFQEVPGQGQLLGQVLRHGTPARLVIFILIMAEGIAGHVHG